jgi:hypothetical protein
MQSLDDLRRACVATVLDPNPDPRLPDERRDRNAGHWMLTTENATLMGHGINRDGYTRTSIGSRFPYLSIGVSVLDQPEQLTYNAARSCHLRMCAFRRLGRSPSIAITRTPCGSRSDAGDDASRRLGRAIDWLRLATLNITSLTNDVRVPSL